MKINWGRVTLAIFLVGVVGILLVTLLAPVGDPKMGPAVIKRDDDQPAHIAISQGNLSEAEIEAELKKRRPVLQEWLEGVEEVIEKTDKDEGALKLMNALAVGRLCMPVQEGILFLEGADGMDFWIAVVPVLPGDRKLNPSLNPSGLQRAGATFSPDTNVMVLHDAEMTRTWRGIIFLHELDHADRFFTSRYQWRDIRTFCYEEMKVHEDQNRWVSKIGGKRYEALVDAEVLRQQTILKEAGMEIGQASASRTDYDTQLDDIFGKALSDDERDFRQTQVWIHGQFRLLDNLPDASQELKDDGKALFLKTIYKQGGILDKLNE